MNPCEILKKRLWPGYADKDGLRKVKLEDFGLGNLIFINHIFCPDYRMLWSISKRLHDLGKNNNYFISSGKIKIRNERKTVNRLWQGMLRVILSERWFNSKLLIEILNNAFFMLSQICCCVILIHSYYTLLKDLSHGEVFYAYLQQKSTDGFLLVTVLCYMKSLKSL